MGFFDWFRKGGARTDAGRSAPESASEDQGPELPSCDELFERFALPWYSEEDLARTGRKPIVRPDLETIAAKGAPSSEICLLTPESASKAVAFLQGLARAPIGDEGELDLGWIAGFDQFHDRTVIAEILASADPAVRMNRYVTACLGFGAALGEVLIELMPGCVWLPSSPLWESALYDPQGGVRINVFDWAVKKMSEYGVDDGYAMKVKVCVGLHQVGWQGVEGGTRDLVPA